MNKSPPAEWRILRNYSLFSGLGDEITSALYDRMHKRQFKNGEAIFTAGTKGEEICFILSGEVQVMVDAVELTRLVAGEQFGEMFLVDIMPRSADIVATQDGEYLVLAHHDLIQIARKNEKMYVMLLLNCARGISQRLRDQNSAFVELKKKHGTSG